MPPLGPGQKLGPYEIVSPLGAGGMGEVYRARDERLARDVALKVLPATMSGDAERLRRFEREARAAAVLNHPNVVVVYDIGTHVDTTYLATELLEGKTLRDELAIGALPVRRAIGWGIQIAMGSLLRTRKELFIGTSSPRTCSLRKMDGRRFSILVLRSLWKRRRQEICERMRAKKRP